MLCVKYTELAENAIMILHSSAIVIVPLELIVTTQLRSTYAVHATSILGRDCLTLANFLVVVAGMKMNLLLTWNLGASLKYSRISMATTLLLKG